MFIYSKAAEFKKKISDVEGSLGLVFDSPPSFFKTGDHAELSLWLKKKGCDLQDSISFYAEDISYQINAFFDQANQEDPKRLFSFTSKVILSIKKYPEIQKIFLINSFIKKGQSSNLIIFCDDQEICSLLKSVFFGKKKFIFKLPSLYAWLRFFKTFLRVFFSYKPKKKATRLLLTLSNSFSPNIPDTYFGDLPLSLSNDDSTITVYICAGKELVFRSKANALPLESFSTINDVLIAWFKTIAECFPLPLKTANSSNNLLFYELSKLMRNVEIKNGDFFYQYFLKRSFHRLFFALKPSVLIYPFENRNWEKLLLLSAYEAQCLETVAYQHSSITPRHLSLKISANGFNPKEYPKKIITVGRFTFDWLRNNSPLISDRLIVGGSLRKIKAKLTLPKSKGILVAISSSFYEANRMLMVMNDLCKKTNKHIPIIIRPHPTINIDLLFNSMTWPNSTKLSKNKELNKDILESHVTIYSSSTVAIEGMLSGRIPIFLNIGDHPSGDPLLGKAIFSASCAEEILSILKIIDGFTKTELKKNQKAVIKFSETYLHSIKSEEFLELL